MELTAEKLVWIMLVLAAVAVSGIYLMNTFRTASEVVGQRVYARPGAVYYTEVCPTVVTPSGPVNTGCYTIQLRVTNGNDKTLTKLYARAVGFPDPAVTVILGGVSSSSSSDYDLWGGSYVYAGEVDLPPKRSTDIIVFVYSSTESVGEKALELKALFEDGSIASFSVPVSG